LLRFPFVGVFFIDGPLELLRPYFVGLNDVDIEDNIFALTILQATAGIRTASGIA